MTETEDFGEPIEGASAAETEPFEAAESVVPTGHAGVDRVLASLEGLADRPVVEHVAVFEQAHEQLRGALSGQPVTGDA